MFLFLIAVTGLLGRAVTGKSGLADRRRERMNGGVGGGAEAGRTGTRTEVQAGLNGGGRYARIEHDGLDAASADVGIVGGSSSRVGAG